MLSTSPAKAESILRLALANWEQAGEPAIHATVAMMLTSLASARHRQGDVASALTINGRALDVLRQLLGPNHSAVVAKMYDQVNLLKAAKRKKEAAAMQKAADRIRAAHGYPAPGSHTVDVRALQPVR